IFYGFLYPISKYKIKLNLLDAATASQTVMHREQLGRRTTARYHHGQIAAALVGAVVADGGAAYAAEVGVTYWCQA
ncbi:hypothetical protein ACJX0J_020289, partial [Zea mays]